MSRNAELIATLSDYEDLPPEASEPAVYDPDWRPSLNPTQSLLYDDPTRFLLAYGERGSGKSVGGIHKLVKHCWENFNALAIVIVGVKRQAVEGGVWHKLEYDILPQWEEGVGMKHTGTKTNVAKDSFVFVSNRFGGWSKIVLLSLPVDSFIRDRFKGLEPSMVLIDEAQTLQSDTYFSVIVQQLGRRQNIAGPQQYVATCNPEGPSHWLHHRFFDSPRDKETGEWNPLYKTYHIPISENMDNLPQGYYENVLEAVKDDPVEYQRMVLGIWVDRPSGDSIFHGYYSPKLHVRGSVKDGTRILPKPGHDIILGYDLGTANSSVSFLQNIPTKVGELWIVFDEMVYTDAYIPLPLLVPEIMRRVQFWGDTVKSEFKTFSVSDSSAFNQFRTAGGSYDVLDVERISRESAKQFPKVKPLVLRECPKFAGSVPARVKVTMKLLSAERLLVSSSCVKTREMFMHLECEKLMPGKYSPDNPFQPKRSKHLHVFDSLSYPLFYFDLGNKVPPDKVKSEMFFMGH